MRALVPEDLARNGAGQRRSLHRAITALALAAAQRRAPGPILKAAWPNDSAAELVLRAASSPTTMAGFPTVSTVETLPALAPGSAAVQLFRQSLQLDLSGVATVRIPHVAMAPIASFIAEGEPAPVTDFVFGA
jgi:hypothetical protein